MSLYYEDICSVIPVRAVEEDEDEMNYSLITELIKYPPIVRWSDKAKKQMATSSNQCLDCSMLVIAIGAVPTGLIKTYILDNVELETVGVVCGGMQESVANTLGQRSHTDHSCFILSMVLHPGVVFILCNEDVPQEHTFSWTNQVVPKLCSSTTSVFVLGSSSIVDYKSPLPPDDIPRNFLRSISSSAFHGLSVCPGLEQPNIISGLSAQILTYCQVHVIGCIVYMSFSAASFPEVETFKAFQSIFCSSPFCKISRVESGFNSRIADLVTQRPHQSDQLYI